MGGRVMVGLRKGQTTERIDEGKSGKDVTEGRTRVQRMGKRDEDKRQIPKGGISTQAFNETLLGLSSFHDWILNYSGYWHKSETSRVPLLNHKPYSIDLWYMFPAVHDFVLVLLLLIGVDSIQLSMNDCTNEITPPAILSV